MIWNPFRAKSGPSLDEDRVWQTGAIRLAGVHRDAIAADPVLVVAHFRSTLAALRRLFEAEGHPCRVYTDRIEAAALARPGGLARSQGIALALAEALPIAPAKAAGDPEALVIAAEHHFVPANDERIVEFCKALPTRSRLRFHESMDAPLLGAFAGESLRRTMQQLGLPAHECIEHRMVTRAIRSAQEKLSEARTGDRPAESPEEWMKLNLPAS